MNPNNPYKLMMDTIQEAYGIIIPRKDQIELVKIYGKNYQQNLKYGYCKAGADEIASIYISCLLYTSPSPRDA